MDVDELGWNTTYGMYQTRSVQRARWLRRLSKAVILLTLPFYCLGFSALGLLRLRDVLQHVATSPPVLGGLLLLLLLVLLEPMTGILTHTCAAGVKCAAAGASHPVGCATFLGLLVLFGIVLWFLGAWGSIAPIF